MAAQQKFFEVIKPGANFDFIGKQKFFIGISVALALLTVVMFFLNAHVIPGRGKMLNWGVDFSGGSEIRLELSRPAEPNPVREALAKGGFHNAEVVKYYEVPNGYMIRMGAVSVLTPEQIEKAKAGLAKVGAAALLGGNRGFSYSDGGDKIYLRYDKHLEVDVVTKALKDAGVQATGVKQFGRAEDNTYEVTLIGLDTEVSKLLNAHLGAGSVKQILGVSSVGAKAGQQLQIDGLKAMLGAIVLIVIYIAIRFDFRYGPGTIVALFHDAFLTVGAFAITYKEFSLTTLAALLTIIGLSMNDTVVVFDRVRENAARHRDRRFDRVVNQSVNETLSRTILTACTVFFVTLAMNIFGTGVIRDFAFAMNVGVVVGTYSTVFIASPILIWLNEKYVAAQKKQLARPDRPRRAIKQEDEPIET